MSLSSLPPEPTKQSGRDLLVSTPGAPAGPTPDADRPRTEDPAPLRAAHTPNFPALLRQLGASLLVTTYQAGKLVLVRDEGDHLNTHYRTFQSPMGLADAGARLALGTTIQVWEFRDVPNVARRLEPAGRHDACYLPRSSHVTGNVLIHEMASGAGGQVWFVNTRFSCLATLDPESSFVPRWRPPLVTELEPSDRCHLNGLAIVPGFTRGLDFAGDLAFVGLSQVRESAVSSGIPITERLAPEQRTCGVCVVDLRRGQTIALLKFESGVQEVFAVAVLRRRFPDLINDDETLLESSFVVPTECLGDVAATVRAAGPA